MRKQSDQAPQTKSVSCAWPVYHQYRVGTVAVTNHLSRVKPLNVDDDHAEDSDILQIIDD